MNQHKQGYLSLNHLDNEEELPTQSEYTHSVKLEQTAKGVRLSVHVYAISSERARQEALKLYCGMEDDCKNNEIVIAPISSNGVKE